MMVSAIERAKSQGGEIGKMEFLKEMDNAPTYDLSENTFEPGDTFTLPATREEVLPFLIKDVYTRLPKSRITGLHPVGYSILVVVKNDKTGKECVKRFRVNAPCNSFAEYIRDDEHDTYITTGKIIGPKNEFAEKIRSLKNQGARLDYMLGKTLKVTDTIYEGSAAIMTAGMVTGIRKRFLPEFTIV